MVLSNNSMKLTLYDNFGRVVMNSNKIMMSVNVYTADNPPVKLKRNTTGRMALPNRNRCT